MGIFSHRRNANRRLRTLKGFCDLLRSSFPAVQHFELPAGQQIVPFFPSIHQFQVSFSRSTSEKRSRVKTKTINIQRYLYHETFFSKQYITLLRIFRQIYIKQSQNGRRTTPSTEGVNGRGGNLANQFPYVVPQPLPSPVSGLPLNSVISPGCVARSINFFVPVARVPVHVHSSVVCTAGAHTHG